MRKKVIIFGGSGYIGSNLIPKLLIEGFQVENFDLHNINLKDEHYQFTKFDALKSNFNKIDLKGCKAVINLIGYPIDKRWNQDNLNKIYESRVFSNKKISQHINNSETKPHVLISASGISIYELNSKKNTEDSPHSDRFIAKLVEDWENAAQESKIRTVCLRQGFVIGKNSPFFKQIIKPFKFYSSVLLGSGKQVVPFIHIEDLCNIYIQSIKNDKFEGIYNAVSPEKDDMHQIIHELEEIRHPFFKIQIPKFILKLFLKDLAEEICGSIDVIPERLKKQRFKFKFTHLKTAILESLDLTEKNSIN